MKAIPRPRSFTARRATPDLWLREVVKHPRELGFAAAIKDTAYGRHMVSVPPAKLPALADEGNFYLVESERQTGTARDLLCATGLVYDEVVDGEKVSVVGYSNVTRRMQGHGIGQFPIAAAIAKRLIQDCDPTLAIVAITFAGTHGAERSLTRIGAVAVSREGCEQLHPALGKVFDDALLAGPQKLRPEDIKFWVFTGPCIRYLLALVYECGDENGYTHDIGRGKPFKIRIGGALTREPARGILHRLATAGGLELPIEIQDVCGVR